MNFETENYILQSRIRTLRRKKRDVRKDFDKKLLRMYNEEMALSKNIRSLDWVDLRPPYQRGWNRFFVLREDVKRDKCAKLYLKVLEKINTSQWSSRKDFKRKRRRYGKKVYVVREQALRQIDEREFFSKRFTDEERALFYEIQVHNRLKKPGRAFVFIDQWRFVLLIRPNMITKVQIRNVMYERRLGEIERFLTTRHLRPRLWRLLDCTYKDWCEIEKPQYLDPLKDKSFSTILNEYWPEPEKQIRLIENPWSDQGFSFCNLFNKLSFHRIRFYLCDIFMCHPIKRGI